ncbi:hypothetical protein ABZS71_03520 [Streptomyces sp. NPDC005393]|uniref:hypothetical protein n=1 Tax=Streptomyces sp. NPDC005393 TaxID=3157041 RepID=UPI0033ACFD99
MAEGQQFDEFLEAVATLRDGDTVRTTAHTSNAATEAWLSESEPADEAETEPTPRS